jgi:hypothetical protein
MRTQSERLALKSGCGSEMFEPPWEDWGGVVIPGWNGAVEFGRIKAVVWSWLIMRLL